MTLAALQALGVPRPLQHFEDEAVKDQLVAAAAFRDCGCGKTEEYPINMISML